MSDTHDGGEDEGRGDAPPPADKEQPAEGGKIPEAGPGADKATEPPSSDD